MDSTVYADASHAADHTIDAIARLASPVCVGLDPVLDRLPHALVPKGDTADSAASALESFSLGVLDAVAGIVPVVKFQSACFERYRFRGVQVLERLIGEARHRDLIVILDAKRGDVGHSATHYADGTFGTGSDTERVSRPNWITVNSYLGEDGIRPFLHHGGGAYALVRTSNPGGDALQSRELADGRSVAECVGEMIAAIGRDFVGDQGFSALGAVVGATKPNDAERLRDLMPQQIFLVPGYGAQGGGIQDVLPCFTSGGRGALITASRSIIYAFRPAEVDWVHAVRSAAQRFADEIGAAVGMR